MWATAEEAGQCLEGNQDCGQGYASPHRTGLDSGIPEVLHRAPRGFTEGQGSEIEGRKGLTIWALASGMCTGGWEDGKAFPRPVFHIPSLLNLGGPLHSLCLYAFLTLAAPCMSMWGLGVEGEGVGDRDLNGRQDPSFVSP